MKVLFSIGTSTRNYRKATLTHISIRLSKPNMHYATLKQSRKRLSPIPHGLYTYTRTVSCNAQDNCIYYSRTVQAAPFIYYRRHMPASQKPCHIYVTCHTNGSQPVRSNILNPFRTYRTQSLGSSCRCSTQLLPDLRQQCCIPPSLFLLIEGKATFNTLRLSRGICRGIVQCTEASCINMADACGWRG